MRDFPAVRKKRGRGDGKKQYTYCFQVSIVIIMKNAQNRAFHRLQRLSLKGQGNIFFAAANFGDTIFLVLVYSNRGHYLGLNFLPMCGIYKSSVLSFRVAIPCFFFQPLRMPSSR